MADIKIRFLSGTLGEASEQRFPAGRVVVGRRVDCDVVLDARHELASGRHLVLFMDDERLWVEDLRSTNGTLVNGKPLSGRTVLAPGDRVTVGPNGPVFAAESVGRGGDPKSLSAPGEVPSRRSVGLETMTKMVRSAVQRERRRTYALAVLALGAGAAGWHAFRADGSRAAEQGPESQLDRWEPSGAEDFQAVLASVAGSVYVVLKRTERAGDSARIVESGSGTAWSIREGFLGTNGHIADLFASLGPGESLLARSNSWPPVDLRITGVRTHPGYRGFSSLIERLRPYDKSSREVLDLPPAYDVALLEIAQEDRSRQAPPLKLASEATIFGLQAGQSIAFVGFPGEGLVRGGTDLARPSAKTAIGTINRVIDPFFGRPVDVSLAHCLEFNIEVVGGASGSPVVNAHGEVIGLINAGDVISETDHGRVGTGGTSYGPRADTMRALDDGVAQSEWDRIRPTVEARMLEIFRDGSAESEEHASQVGAARLETLVSTEQGDWKGEYSWTFKGRVKLEKPGPAGRVTLEIPTGTPGLRALIAIAEGEPMALRMEGYGRVDRDRLLGRVEGEESASTVDARLIEPSVGGETLRIELEAEDDRFFGSGEVAVYLLRLD